MRRKVLMQVADTGPLESLAHMLTEVGYEPHLPSEGVKRELRALGCDTVLDVDGLVKGLGYDRPFHMPTMESLKEADLYVDVKAHRNGPKVWARHPRLQERTLWYRINGGEPEHIPYHGDERNPPCPVVTPNLWYRGGDDPRCVGAATAARSYAFWPPFVRWNEYKAERKPSGPPVCLIHNVQGWGYAHVIDVARELGVKCYGAGSPDGLLQHREMKKLLREAVCMVHLKSNDAPGYSLYEAIAARCPIVVSRRLAWRCRMEELYNLETCFMFDRATHDAPDVEMCKKEMHLAIEALKHPKENRRAGEALHIRLKGLMWTAERDAEGFAAFLRRVFP